MSNPKKGLALVIANAEYQSQPKLPSCKKDGHDVAEKLMELNFDILYHSDTTRSKLLTAIAEFIEQADLYSVLVVYYSGHGVQIDGENYLVPIECTYTPVKSVFIASSLVSINTITSYMNDHNEKTNILILDACRTGLSFVKNIGSKGLAEISAGNGTLIAFATSPNTYALCDSSADGNGYYTNRLLEHIDHPNLKIEDMFKLVRRDVAMDTSNQQIPWESTSLNKDFCFCSMTQDEIYETIYQIIRVNYSAETVIYVSKRFGYTISDVMRIHQHQKSEKVGGIYFSEEAVFEQFITEQILQLGFSFSNYRWVYNGMPVLMGDLKHNINADIRTY